MISILAATRRSSSALLPAIIAEILTSKLISCMMILLLVWLMLAFTSVFLRDRATHCNTFLKFSFRGLATCAIFAQEYLATHCNTI